jgi:hypothetical protein
MTAKTATTPNRKKTEEFNSCMNRSIGHCSTIETRLHNGVHGGSGC